MNCNSNSAIQEKKNTQDFKLQNKLCQIRWSYWLLFTLKPFLAPGSFFPPLTPSGRHLLIWFSMMPFWCPCPCGILSLECWLNLVTCSQLIEYHKGDGMSLLRLYYKTLTFVLLAFSLAIFLWLLWWIRSPGKELNLVNNYFESTWK